MARGDCIRAGMARARVAGRRVGRPSVLERPDVAADWTMMRRRIQSGELSQREAARLLGVSEHAVRHLLATNYR